MILLFSHTFFDTPDIYIFIYLYDICFDIFYDAFIYLDIFDIFMVLLFIF